LLSIETAISFGVDVVEIDVHRSRDGHPIVMHDERVDRTTNGSGYIRDLTLEQIQALKTVPTLTEVLQAVNGRAALMIELKVRNIIGDVEKLVATVAPELPVYYASFLHSELLHPELLKTNARTIALIDGVPVASAAFAVDARAAFAGVAFDSLEPGFVRELQAAGVGVFTYTVDDPRDIVHAQSMGVDGIISNFPDRLLAR